MIFDITEEPSQGKIQVGESEVNEFTQADLEKGNVEYNHTSQAAEDDSFNFELEDSDGDGPDEEKTFKITVGDPDS